MNDVRARVSSAAAFSEAHSGLTMSANGGSDVTRSRSSPRDRCRFGAGCRDRGSGPRQQRTRSAADLLAATRKFLDGLEPDKRKAASFAWDGSEWRSWNYFGVGGFIKPGLRLQQMSAAQKEAAWDLLATLSARRRREDPQRDDFAGCAGGGNGAGQRSSQRFSFAVYGTPAEAGAWGFRLEGHHLTESIAVRDNRIVAVSRPRLGAARAHYFR